MIPSALLAAAGLAFAQTVTAVPPGATTVTVLVCRAADGCPDAARALDAHLAQVGAPLLRFDDVARAGPGGGDARLLYDAALARLDRQPGLAAAEDARRALDEVPLTVPAGDILRVQLALGARRLAAGDAAGADLAFAAAVSAGDARTWDLPPLPEPALARYVHLATEPAGAPATLLVTADADPATVYVDGRAVGAAPVEVQVRAGWHRVTVERPGRLTAWSASVSAPAGRTLPLAAAVADDDTVTTLSAALAAAARGVQPPAAVPERLAAWAEPQGLRWVRFVTLEREAPGGPAPEERIADPDGGAWEVHAAWLDVGAGRFAARGPGPATLRAASGWDRFRLGVGVGYARLAPLTDALDPHDHVAIDVGATLRLRPWLRGDARFGVLRSAQLYYLKEGVVERDVYPLMVGARVHPEAGGPYAGAHALVILPMAVGGQLFAGWEAAPSPRWRLGAEARAGLVDDGWLLGGGLTVAFSD